MKLNVVPTLRGCGCLGSFSKLSRKTSRRTDTYSPAVAAVGQAGQYFRWSWKAAKEMINLKSTCHLMISRVLLCNFTLHTCRLRWRISSLQEIHPRRSGWKLPTRRRHSKKSRWKHEKISFAMWIFSTGGLHPPFGSFRSPGTGRSKVAEQKWKELTMLLPTGCNLRTWSLWMDWL